MITYLLAHRDIIDKYVEYNLEPEEEYLEKNDDMGAEYLFIKKKYIQDVKAQEVNLLKEVPKVLNDLLDNHVFLKFGSKEKKYLKWKCMLYLVILQRYFETNIQVLGKINDLYRKKNIVRNVDIQEIIQKSVIPRQIINQLKDFSEESGTPLHHIVSIFWDIPELRFSANKNLKSDFSLKIQETKKKFKEINAEIENMKKVFFKVHQKKNVYSKKEKRKGNEEKVSIKCFTKNESIPAHILIYNEIMLSFALQNLPVNKEIINEANELCTLLQGRKRLTQKEKNYFTENYTEKFKEKCSNLLSDY